MAEDENWTAKRVAAARKGRALVTDVVAVHVEKLLAASLQQARSSAELARIASALLSAMVPVPPNGETKT